MEPGNKVMIFGDPITKTDCEGQATLIREYRPDQGDGRVVWIVIFDDEPGREFARVIYTQ